MARQGQQRCLDGGQGLGGLAGGLQHRLGDGAQGAFHAEFDAAARSILGCPCPELFQRRQQEALDRPDRIDLAGGRGDAAGDALAGQLGGGANGVLQRLGRRRVVGAEVAEPLFQPPSAPAATLGPAQPAAQLGGLLTGQAGRESAVGRVEQVVALVEHDPLQGRRLTVLFQTARRPGPVEGGLGHDQGVVGHDQIGPAAGADGLFDETGAVVGAGGVDAFAAPVDEVGRAGLMARPRGEQAGQPAGIVAAGHVAVTAVHGPAADERHADQVAVPQLGRLNHVLQVQQAEVVFAALADDGLLPALDGVGPEGGALAVDLALQGAGIGRDPGRPLIALGPQAGWGEIAQGLAGACAGLRQQEAGPALFITRGEGIGGLGGIVGLGRAGLVEPGRLKQFLQTDTGALAVDRCGAGLAARGLVLPLRQARPDVEPAAAMVAVADGLMLQGPRDPPGPCPAGAAKGLGEGKGGLAVGIGRVGQFAQQAVSGAAQGLRLGLCSLRLAHAHGEGKTAGRGGTEAGGPRKGEQLQHVQQIGRARRRGDAEAARGQAGVGDHDGGGGEGPLGRAAPDLARALAIADRPRARRNGERRRQGQPGLGAGEGGRGGEGVGGHGS